MSLFSYKKKPIGKKKHTMVHLRCLQKIDLNRLKTEVDNLDVDKPKTVHSDLSNSKN